MKKNSFRSLLRQLAPESNLHHHIGHISNPSHRTKAVKIIKNGGIVQFIIGNEKNGVGGIFFDIDNLQAVDIVIRSKSTDQKTRHAMFAVMTPDDYFHQISALKYRPDLSRLSEHPCFIRIPVKEPDKFPPHAVTQNSSGRHIVQTFPSDLVPHFREFIREAASFGMRIGGTSLNYTGQGNLTSLEDVASFYISSPGPKYWLETPARFTGVSWTIIELHHQKKEITPHREGSSPYNAIAEALFGLKK